MRRLTVKAVGADEPDTALFQAAVKRYPTNTLQGHWNDICQSGAATNHYATKVEYNEVNFPADSRRTCATPAVPDLTIVKFTLSHQLRLWVLSSPSMMLGGED